jgi:sporulation protein YlmC with PRC-barrel domain
MTNNIVSTVTRLLTPEVISRLASASGLPGVDNAGAQRAVGAAVPSILNALADVAAKPGGARQLANAVAEHPADMVGSITATPAGSAQMAEKGNNLLGSLLGGDVLGALASTLSRFVGIGEGSTRTLLGLLTPLIMSVLGREQRAAGLDADGLARMLTGQKQQITAAMPSGLSRLLEGGRYEAIGSTSAAESRVYERAAYDPPRMASAQRVVGDSSARTQGLSWPYWVLPLAALGGLLWYLLSDRQAVEPVQTSQPTSVPAPTAEAKTIYLTKIPENWSSIRNSSNEFVNQDIYNRAGEKLGTIREVLIGPDGGTAALIVNVGQFLGIGDKDIAVPFSALQLEQRDKSRRIIIDARKEALQVAPSIERRKQ